MSLHRVATGDRYDWTFTRAMAGEGGDVSGRVRETVVLTRDGDGPTADELVADAEFSGRWTADVLDDATVEFTRDVRVERTDVAAHATNLYRTWRDAPPTSWRAESADVDVLNAD